MFGLMAQIGQIQHQQKLTMVTLGDLFIKAELKKTLG